MLGRRVSREGQDRMGKVIAVSVKGVPIRLTQERWNHIFSRHPELKHFKDWLAETIQDPERVYEGGRGESLAVRYYPSSPVGAKFLIVVYKEVSHKDGFVITAYFTNKPRIRGREIWRKPQSSLK
jgi:hypothetical protein